MPDDFIFWGALAVLLSAIIAAIIALAIDFLNARRSIRDRKYEILSQISQKSYHGYRVLRSHTLHHHNFNFHVARINSLNPEIEQLTIQLGITTQANQKEKIKYSLKIHDINRDTWKEVADYHQAERQRYEKQMEEIDAELHGLKTLFIGFFNNNIVRLRINQMTEFNLEDYFRVINQREYQECSKETNGAAKIIKEAWNKIDEKFLYYVKTLNQELIREMKNRNIIERVLKI